METDRSEWLGDRYQLAPRRCFLPRLRVVKLDNLPNVRHIYTAQVCRVQACVRKMSAK